jgi:hypothetical protein
LPLSVSGSGGSATDTGRLDQDDLTVVKPIEGVPVRNGYNVADNPSARFACRVILLFRTGGTPQLVPILSGPPG